jgi:signal transduction histidine kinase/DICT domain-containing protein/ActR/RegA family two-component response regulator
MTLVHLSHALEDIVLRERIPALLFTGFQESGHWRKETARYRALAEVAQQVCIFAGRMPPEDSNERTLHVRLMGDDPLRQEWFLCILSERMSVVLCGQDQAVPAGEEALRQFDTLWTFDPEAINEVLDLMEQVIGHYRPERLAPLQEARRTLPPIQPDPKLVTELTRQMIEFEEILNRKAQEEIQERTRIQADLRQRLAQRAVIAELSQLALTGQQPEQMIRHMVEQVAQIFGCDYSAYYEYKDEEDVFQLWYAVGKQPLWSERIPAQDLSLPSTPEANRYLLYTGDGAEDPLLRGIEKVEGDIQRALVSVPGRNAIHGLLLLGIRNLEPRRLPQESHFLNTVTNVYTLYLERYEFEMNLQKAYADLRATNSELERASRAKDEFLAAMSHELRTPLNAILGLTEAMIEEVYGFINDRQHTSLHNIHESGQHLLSLINDILDISKIEAGKYTIEADMLDVESICQASLRLIRQNAQRKGLKMSLEIDPQASMVYADPRAMKQILVNLLSNAAKFTPEGGKFGLKVQASPEKAQITFAVWDEGIGIAEEDLPRLFKPFVQLDSSLAREYSGTGLGLSLLHRLVTLHQGSVAVESRPGQGSTFSFTLPWSEAVRYPLPNGGTPQWPSPDSRPAQDDSQSAGADGRQVLLVEDNKINVLMFSDFLRTLGYQVVVAWNGHEALDLVRSFLPDLILMDIQMPGLDGMEAIRRLRMNKILEQIPIIAVTSLAMPGDKQRCLDAGADYYMSKPVSLKQLRHLLMGYPTRAGLSGRPAM